MNIKSCFLLLIIFFSSCHKDVCGPGFFENLFLSEESNSYFFYEGIEKAIFVDMDNNEYEFTITHSDIEREDFSKTFECEEGSLNVSFERERKEVILTDDFIESPMNSFNISLTTEFDHAETTLEEDHLIDIMDIWHRNDGVRIITRSIYATSNRGGLVDLNLVNDNFNEIENFEMHGRNFDSVIERKFTSSYRRTIYYSKKQGIVGFYNHLDSLVVLDRFE